MNTPTDSKTKWGLDQMSRPAPLWYRRLTNAMIVCFIPAFVAAVQTIPMSADAKNICMCIATGIPFIMKGIGMVMGNGQFYSPSNETIDKQREENKQ